MTATPPPLPAWRLGFYSSVSRVGFSDRGNYVYQHFREIVNDQPKSPEVTTLPLCTKSARLEIGYSGIRFCLTQGFCGKNGLFLDLSRSPMQSCTPRIYIKSPQRGTSHSSFLLQSPPSFSHLCSLISLFPLVVSVEASLCLC